MTNNLSTQNRKSYTYLILFYDGYFYYGVRLCPKDKAPWQDIEYSGSPKTHKDKWNKVKFTKFILEVFDDYDIAQKREKELIKSNLNNPICLNESIGGVMSIESRRKGGKTQGRKNVKSGQLLSISSRGGKIGGRKNVESGQIYSIQSKGGKIGSKNTNYQKWRCLITGYVSNPGALSKYQKAKGINTSLRERVL